MKAQATLVGTDRVIKLHSIAALITYIPIVVGPGHPKHDDPIGLGHAFQDLHLVVYRLVRNIRKYGFGHFGYGLMKFALARISLFNAVDEALEIDLSLVG
jgi:hypothetical protein